MQSNYWFSMSLWPCDSISNAVFIQGWKGSICYLHLNRQNLPLYLIIRCLKILIWVGTWCTIMDLFRGATNEWLLLLTIHILNFIWYIYLHTCCNWLNIKKPSLSCRSRIYIYTHTYTHTHTQHVSHSMEGKTELSQHTSREVCGLYAS